MHRGKSRSTPPALLLHAAIEFLDASVNFALGNAALLGQRNPIVRCWFLCNRLSTGICRRRRRAGNVLKRKILFRSRRVRCVPRARSEKCKRGGCETKGRDLIMRSLRRDTMHRTMQARDAREIDSEPYVTLGSIKVCALPPGCVVVLLMSGRYKAGRAN